MRLYCSTNIQINGGEWSSTASNDKDYASSFRLTAAAGIVISAGESWTMGDVFRYAGVYSPFTNTVYFKLQVFYGADKPAEPKFIIRFKQ